MSQVREAPGRQPIARGPSDRRALAVMTSAHGIQHLYVAGLAVAYPFVVTQFHVSYALLGVVLTAAGMLGGFLQASAGLARRASTAIMLVGQNAGMGLASVLAAVAPGFAVFGVARVLGSAASWPQHPVGSAYLSRRFPHRRATVLSWHVAGGSAGTVVAPLFISALISTVGWRWARHSARAACWSGWPCRRTRRRAQPVPGIPCAPRLPSRRPGRCRCAGCSAGARWSPSSSPRRSPRAGADSAR